MKRFIVILAALFLISEIQAQSNLQIQAKKVFEEAIQPNEKGSVRNLHKTSKYYNFYGDCLDLENKSNLKKEVESSSDISVSYEYQIPDTEAHFIVNCYEGYGGSEYFIDIRSLNKELLEEVRKLLNEYFNQNLAKQSNGKYVLGDFETEIKAILKDRKTDEWYFWVYMFNNAW